MKVLFFNPQQEMVGLQCLSAYLKRAGHRTALFNDPRLFDNAWFRVGGGTPAAVLAEGFAAVERHAPDLIGFPVVSDDYGWALDWAARLKERFDVPIVFGNAHPTFHPEEVLSRPQVDFVVRGEGEETLLELVEALGRAKDFSRILGLGYKDGGRARINPLRPLIEDLDSLPFPDKDLHYSEMPYLNHGYVTLTGRGCPYRCTFCDNASSARLYADGAAGRRWTRRRSPESAVAELVRAKERWGVEHVRFNDEDFAWDRRWLAEFTELHRAKAGLPYFAWVHPNTIDDATARLLARGGCDSVEMGIQSGSERLRVEVLNRRTPNDRIAGALAALRREGIRADVDVIVGLPTETKADLDATVELLRRGRPWGVYAFWLQYYPSTEIFRYARERGLLPEGTGGAARVEGAGIHREGAVARDAVTRRYRAFLTLLPMLPDALIRLLQRRDWVRWFPPAADTLLVHQARRALKGGGFNEVQVRGWKMLRWEGARALGRLVGRAQAGSLQGMTS